MKTIYTYPKEYDVIVVGAGHAGCEAALATARMGFPTLLLSINLDTTAQMSCNTCIGGIAKGQIVREIDAIGGEMAKNADLSGLQFRMLNMSKGPAVRSPRAQCDKKLYQFTMKHTLEKQKNLDFKQGEVIEIVAKRGKVCSVITTPMTRYKGKTVIVTTGTFLKGVIHIGESIFRAGRGGEFPADHLSGSLAKLGFEIKRLKTGTPPRVNARSLDYSKMIEQPADKKLIPFSHFTDRIRQKQLSCWLAYTRKKTHDIIAANFHRAPLFSGQITGIGPRYCPSIEDKVRKFPEKTRHQLFLEPEGYNTEEIYCNGLSTSLPVDVQTEMIHSIIGMEKAELLRPGYAIEYDFCPPTQLKPNLETKRIANLWFAGQINGTSGYEEAAGQGLMAGINAGLKLKDEEPFILDRSEAYIGVLIDDLVTKGVLDPYRMFTSRAEYRLILRSDNADMRLMKYGHQFGLISGKNYRLFLGYKTRVEKEITRFEKDRGQGSKASLATLIRQGKLTDDKLTGKKTAGKPSKTMKQKNSNTNTYIVTPERIRYEAFIEIKYAGYIKRQNSDVAKFRNTERKRIPDSIDYSKIKGLLTESKQKFIQIRPISIGQASRISGVTPADISILLVYLEKLRRSKHI